MYKKWKSTLKISLSIFIVSFILGVIIPTSDFIILIVLLSFLTLIVSAIGSLVIFFETKKSKTEFKDIKKNDKS